MVLVEINPNQPEEMWIDEEDEALWLAHTWCFDGRYVKRKVNGKRNGPDKPRDPAQVFYFHREVMNAKDGEHVDHIDGNKLNNCKSNLRVCSQDQNNKNVSGVGAFLTKSGKWEARLMHNYKTVYIGRFDTYEEAFEAYRLKSIELRGEFSAHHEVNSAGD